MRGWKGSNCRRFPQKFVLFKVSAPEILGARTMADNALPPDPAAEPQALGPLIFHVLII